MPTANAPVEASKREMTLKATTEAAVDVERLSSNAQLSYLLLMYMQIRLSTAHTRSPLPRWPTLA